MDDFVERDGRLLAEGVPLSRIADAVGTPAYVYSRSTLLGHFRRLKEAFAEIRPHIGYAVKANGNLAILRLLAEEGARFDVVSRGEIFRVLRAGVDPSRIDFEGPGKRKDEIEYALDRKVRILNVESEAELDLIDEVAAAKGLAADVGLRVNPDVDPKTHVYISTGKAETKFGLDIERTRRLAATIAARKHVRLKGLHVHIGSQITEPKPYVEMVTRLLALAKELKRDHPSLVSVNTGGGFGIHYRGNEAPEMREFAAALVPLLKDSGFEIHMEPGRLLVGNAGVLLTRVIYVKRSGEKRFVICDAAMNDLIRPSLYGAFHRIEPVGKRGGAGGAEAAGKADVVGPVCESGDFLGKDRDLPAVEPGDLLCVRSAGAYGFVMASNYNARPRAAEVLVDGRRFAVVRQRETFEDLVRGETADPEWNA
ncbi:MAG TPA: diaminopimelate decarboxylase [Planctomycetota bacterium]|nr:diaminopimelate decarboxylase [Planctomycetota bacterium]